METGISRAEVAALAAAQFGDMVKAVVDLGDGRMVVGGELHSDQEALLLARGARQEDLWGVNFYPDRSGDDWIEFDSMINVRPAAGNRTRNVQEAGVRERIRGLVRRLVKD